MLPTKFLFIWQSGFGEEDFQKSTNQKQELPVAAIFVIGLGRNEQSLQKTSHRCFLPSFGSFIQEVSEENILFRNEPISNKNIDVAAMFVSGSEQNVQSLQRTFHRCFLPSFSSSKWTTDAKSWRGELKSPMIP